MTSAVVIAGVRSGVGKTTIASGVMGALARRGLRVQPFKAGPDYIDPSYHTIACGVPSRNLDTWMLPHPVVSELFHRAAGAADIAVVEGVMGVFDGHSSLDEDGSTAQLAKLLDAPVILIADAGKVARSVAAEILGYQQFDPDLRIAGVILNGVGSERHLEFCQPQIEATTGLPVVGWLPRRDDLVQPERHLGLIPTAEGTVLNNWYDALNAQIQQTIDLDAITRIAATAGRPNATSEGVFPRRPRLREPPSPLPKTALSRSTIRTPSTSWRLGERRSSPSRRWTTHPCPTAWAAYTWAVDSPSCSPRSCPATPVCWNRCARQFRANCRYTQSAAA